MKVFVILCLFSALLMDAIPLAHAQSLSITIDVIEENISIRGRVIGLGPNEISVHKVVVYVQTDQWYVHPYGHGGEGRSWASVLSDGTWEISTVRRDFPATAVAAILVTIGHPVETRLRRIHKGVGKTYVIYPLEGTPDFGKL